jgi:hypothetical protein
MFLPDATGKKYHILFDHSVNFPNRDWHKYTMIFVTLRSQFKKARHIFFNLQPRFLLLAGGKRADVVRNIAQDVTVERTFKIESRTTDECEKNISRPD